MSDITVNVTSAGAANVSVSNGSTVNASVGNGGVVNVAIGTITPGNSTVVSGTLTINSVTTLSAGSQAYVKNDAGTAYAAKLDIGIPAGPATLVSVGNTTTLASGSNATVNGTTSGSNLTLAFGIPRGANGINGVTPSFAIGNVTTGAAGSSASVSATATNGGANVTLDLTIPRGDPGTSGSNGTNGTSITLSDGTPANLGAASPGTSNLAARADHTHSLPVINYANLSGVPSNFPTNTTLVSGLSAGYSAANHAHNYVTEFNNLTGALTLAAGSNVTLTANGSTLTLSSTGGLGANDAVDGGDYVGTIINGIAITSQPASANASTAVGSWSAQNSPANLTVSGLGYANNTFLALGTGKVASSSNLASWTNANLPQNFAAAEVAYGNGTYVVVGRDVPFPVAKSTDGSTWTSASGDTSFNYNFSSIAYGGGLFVGMLQSQSNASYLVNYFTSSDGASWTTRSMPYNSANLIRVSAVTDIAYGNGVFVATVTSKNLDNSSNVLTQYLTSTDGLTWTIRTLPSSGWYASVAFGAGVFVLLPQATASSATTNVAYTSADGISWTARTLPVSNFWSRVRWCGDAFVATKGAFGVGTGSGTDVAWSSTGATWTLGTLPSTGEWYYVSGGGGTALVASAAAMARASIAAGSVSFSAAATVAGGASLSYQWQISTDAGSTWSNISGSTSTTLSLAGLTSGDNGKRYRCAISATGATTVFTQSAILTVS